MKFIGMIMLVLCSTMVGVLFVEKSKQRINICNQLIHFCDLLLIDYGYALTPTVMLVENLLSNVALCDLDFITQKHIKSKTSVKSCLSEEENEKLSEFLYSLGKTDIKGQIKLVEAFKSYIQLCHDNYSEYHKKNNRIYLSFGFFGGLAVSLILV